MRLKLLIGCVVGVVVLGLVLDFHYSYREDANGVLQKAVHIRLPGFKTVYSPENIVFLDKWVGTRLDLADDEKAPFWLKDGLSLLSGLSLKDYPDEFMAGLSLMTTSMCPYAEYELQQNSDRHWVLYKPEETWKEFSLRVYYRIGPYFKAEN